MNHRGAQADFDTRKALHAALPIAVILLLAMSALAAAQDSSRPIKPSEAVKTQVYVSLDPVPRGRQFEVAAVAEVAPGYHVQANKVLQDYLIPLTLTPEVPAGFRVVSTGYPKANVVKFGFAKQPMAVYEGRFVVRIKLEAAAGVPTGSTTIPITLRFQACNDQLCLPPTKLPLSAEFEVAPAGAAAKAVHPEIFRKE
ncbi:MAG TPA: protein-disulfide reductase DsbD domain-containing protein [Candidatus Acidoferrales bacterium]|nr:protein-disulfide reductase DsbD domain-containing protein [Candidatus Acidoferrales bacterium]